MLNFKFSTVAKLITLLFVIGISFSFLSILTYDNMTKMKKSIDLIYFGSYVQVVKLKEINEYIGEEIPEIVVKYNNKKLSGKKAVATLKGIQESIVENWDYYKNSYKREDEKILVANSGKVIKATLSWIDDLKNGIERGRYLSIKNMFDNITTIKKEINKVIKHETDGAYLQKQEINEGFERTLIVITFILVATFTVMVSIAYFIIKSINRKENKLFRLAKELNYANVELKNLTITDPLTTLFNRRYFNTVFDKEFKKAVREKKPITFMMIDIDFFKKYNDTYGHIEGDENLKQVSKTLKETLRRPNDYAFRLGGEEFGVLINDYPVNKASDMAEKLVEAVRELEIEHKASDVASHVTISLGFISIIPDSTTNQDKLIQSADEALYQAKTTGRNKSYGRFKL